MSKLKTQPNEGSVEALIQEIEDTSKRNDSQAILDLMQEITGEVPVLWGTNMVGFGRYHYKYASGREGDWFKVGFAPRKQYMSVYLTYPTDRMDELRAKLGKHKSGKACLNIKKLEDIDQEVLGNLIRESIQYIDKQYPPTE